MGMFDRLFGKKDLRNDPRCPINVAQENIQRALGYPSSAKMTFGGFTKDPNHPVCKQCARRNEEICT